MDGEASRPLPFSPTGPEERNHNACSTDSYPEKVLLFVVDCQQQKIKIAADHLLRTSP